MTGRLSSGAWLLAALVICLLACGGSRRDGREHYNTGLRSLGTSDFEAADRAFLAALDQGGVDPELRYRAAFNLGVSASRQAAKAQAATPPETENAMQRYQQAAGWFRDALRVKYGREASATSGSASADPAASNLALVLAKQQALADELSRGKNGLAPRLDQLIADQRVLRDETARLLHEQSGAGADPTGQLRAGTALADRQRALTAEAGAVLDLAGDEIDGIGKKEEGERSPEENVRLVQLKNLDVYLQGARNEASGARRKLQVADAAAGFELTEKAVALLKRAREQLLDPVAVLRGVAEDQMLLLRESTAVRELGTLGSAAAASEQEGIGERPAWLSDTALAARQAGLGDRCREIHERLAAALVDPPSPATQPANTAAPAPAEADAENKRMLEMVRAAAPSVEAAAQAMSAAQGLLTSGKMVDAVEQETAALKSLARAIEQFADLRMTIDLAVRGHKGVLELLRSFAEPGGDRNKSADAGRTARDETASNLERMGRIASLLREEAARIDQQLAQLPAGDDGGAQPQAGDAADARAQLTAAKEQLAKAEPLRLNAEGALRQFSASLGRGKGNPIPLAQQAMTKLEELRKLFFSVVEHLRQLIQDQGETRDRTASAHGLGDDERAPLLPSLSDRQNEHAQMGDAIAGALAAQADAAAAAEGGGAEAEEQRRRLLGASEEVRTAHAELAAASASLATSKEQAKLASTDLQPALDQQAKALEHLANALRLLEPPPPPQDQNQQDQQKQDGSQDEQQQQQDTQQQGKQEQQDQQQQGDQQQDPKNDQPSTDPSGALQRLRDEESRRQKQRREQQRPSADPVDKDW